MSQITNSTTSHLKFCYISIFYKLLWTDNETKSVQTTYNYTTRSIKKDKKELAEKKYKYAATQRRIKNPITHLRLRFLQK